MSKAKAVKELRALLAGPDGEEADRMVREDLARIGVGPSSQASEWTQEWRELLTLVMSKPAPGVH